MSWYWIVLIVVCYVLLSAVTCIIFSRLAKDTDTDDEAIVFAGIFWPLIVILLPIILLTILLDKIVDKYRYGGNSMKAPDKVYIDDLAVINDCTTKISIKPLPNFSEYIRKDTLMEWAKDMKAETEDVMRQHPEDESLWAEMHWWEVVIAKINVM